VPGSFDESCATIPLESGLDHHGQGQPRASTSLAQTHATLCMAFVILRATPAAAPLQLYYSCSLHILTSTAALGCTSHIIWPAVDLDAHAQAGRVDRRGGIPLRAGQPGVGLEGGVGRIVALHRRPFSSPVIF
jgi:hypothetical protein